MLLRTVFELFWYILYEFVLCTSVDHKNIIFYHSNITLINQIWCILVILCVCVPGMNGTSICYHYKLILEADIRSMRMCFKITKIARLHRRLMSTRPDFYELMMSHCFSTPLHRPFLPPRHLFLHPRRTILHRPLTSPCSTFSASLPPFDILSQFKGFQSHFNASMSPFKASSSPLSAWSLPLNTAASPFTATP